MNRKQQRARGNFISIILISFGHLCHDIYTSFLAPILPLLIKKLSLSYSSAGLISVMLRLPSLFNPFIGAYAERLNLKYIVIASPTITAVSMCLMGNTDSFYFILALALAAGIGSSCFHVPTPVLLKELAGNKVGAAMSSFQIGGELSRTIGPMVVLAAVSLWGLEGIYRLIPIGVSMSVIFYFLFRNLEHKKAPVHHGIGGSIKDTLAAGKTLYIAIAGILLSKAFTATIIAAYLPTYMTAMGENLWFAGASLSIVQGASIAGVLSTGTLSDKIGCKKMLAILTTATPLTMLLFIYSEGPLTLAALVLVGYTAFSSSPVFLALIQKRGFRYPSIANGLFMTINFMLSSTMILAAGKCSDMFGIQTMFRWAGYASFAGIPFLLFLREE